MQSTTTAPYAPRYNPRFTTTYNVPDRNASSETVNKILLKVASGSYFEIEKAIVQERSSLGISDVAGRTIIHHILLNGELIKNDKYKLINNVIGMGAGASIDIPDKDGGVRPLHIAAGQQNREVVKLLLEKKAEVNSKDNNYLTPLHYAVLPETTTCPEPSKKVLIPDEPEAIMSDFRTDDMFNKLFDFVKDDTIFQRYVSHLANIFKNRHVYQDQENDQKELSKLIKETIGEKSNINANEGMNESMKAKLVDFKKSIYQKTRTNLGKTYSKLDIKENTPNGWAPDYNGVNNKNKEHAILPFANLQLEFSEQYRKFRGSRSSVISNLLAQIERVKKGVFDMEQYVMDTNDLMNVLIDCNKILKVYSAQLGARGIDVNVLRRIFRDMFDKYSVSAYVATPHFDERNVDKIRVNRSPLFDNGENEHNFFNRPPYSPLSTQPNLLGPVNSPDTALDDQIGLGNVLIMYIEQIKKLLNEIDTKMLIVTDAIQNQGLDLDDQLEIVTHFGDVQIKLINICYILLLLNPRAGSLSFIIEEFKTSLVNHKMVSAVEYIANFINKVIEQHDAFRKTHQNTPLRIRIFDANTNAWRDIPSIEMVVELPIPPSDNMMAHVFLYVDPNGRRHHMIARVDNLPVPLVSGFYLFNYFLPNAAPGAIPGAMAPIGAANVGAPSGYILYDHKIPTQVASNMSIIDVSRLINRLDKITEQGGLGKEGKVSENNVIINTYKSLYDLQDRINSMIDIHNTLNGFIFSNRFNNGMIDDSYNIATTNIFRTTLMTMMKKLTRIPDTYHHFSDAITPILYGSVGYTSDTAIATIKNLINTYGYQLLNPSSILYIIRYPGKPGINSNAHRDGLLSHDDTIDRGARIRHDPDKITIGTVHTEVNDNIRYHKTNDFNEQFSIIGSVADTHIYLIKLIMIMYVVSEMSFIYTGGSQRPPTVRAEKYLLYVSMKNIHDQIDDITNKNSLGILFAIIGKMVDEIILSTIESISNLGAANYVQFLMKNTRRITSIPLSSLLGAVNWTDISALVTKPDDKVRIKDAAMLTSVVTSGSIITNNVDIMRFFAKDTEIDESDRDNIFNRLIDFDTVERNTDVCYKIDNDLIGVLLDAGADPNARERTGETPLTLGVLLQNETIVDTLLRSKARVVSSDKNIYDMCYEKLLKSIKSSPIMNIDELNIRVEDHLMKKSGMTKTFANNKLILKMISYMFMHQLTSVTNGYPNMWTKESQDKIMNMLNLSTVHKNIIPLATINPSLIEETVSGYATFRDTLDTLANKLSKEREIFIRLDNSLKNLGIELGELGPEDNYRRAEILQMQDELNNQHTQTDDMIKKTISDINRLRDAKRAKSNVGEADQIKRQIQESNELFRRMGTLSSRNICNIYDVYFNKIINIEGPDRGVFNSEYTTYIECWASLLARPEEECKTDQTQMIGTLMKYINEMGIVEPSIFLNAYTPICDLYDTVLVRYGRDYKELMPYLGKDGESPYEQNYVLKQIYCIMYHVFKHTMSINFIVNIAQLLARRDKGRRTEDIMRNVYEAMKSSEFIKYCVEVVPRQVIKTTCKIAATEKDPDTLMTVTDILNKALDRLSISTFESVDKNTIDYAKENIVPFFVTYMEAYTAEMHSFMVKQIKMMMVQGRLFDILKLLANKAVMETENK